MFPPNYCGLTISMICAQSFCLKSIPIIFPQDIPLSTAILTVTFGLGHLRISGAILSNQIIYFTTYLYSDFLSKDCGATLSHVSFSSGLILLWEFLLAGKTENKKQSYFTSQRILPPLYSFKFLLTHWPVFCLAHFFLPIPILVCSEDQPADISTFCGDVFCQNQKLIIYIFHLSSSWRQAALLTIILF